MEKAKKLYPLKFEAGVNVLDEKSVVSNGFLSENNIDDLIETYLGDFLGHEVFQYYRGEFPVKISYISPDSHMPLQTHPDDYVAFERYDAPGCAKIWYVQQAAADACLYMGFNKEMDAGRFYKGCLDGSIKGDLCSFKLEAGDCIYIKPGTVYALCGEAKVVEVSQNSTVTYHLCDMNSTASEGADFQMEIAEAIDVIDYAPFESEKYYFKNISGNLTIADTSDFVVKHIELGAASDKVTLEPAALNSFVAYLCVKGAAAIKTADGSVCEFSAGEFAVVPANMDEFALEATEGESEVELFEVYMPQLSDSEDLYLNYYEDESNYPVGSGLDPEDDEDFDDDEFDHECGCGDDECGCGAEHHHHHSECGCGAHHHNGGHHHHFAQSASNSEIFDLEKIHMEQKANGEDNSSERFFKKR